MISLCITTWNRDSMTFDSFRNVLYNDIISEIVIVDDCSDERIYSNLAFMVNGLNKVKLYRNDRNLGCYYNKRRVVELASNEWVILFDSDNIIGPDYISSISGKELNRNYIYQPEYARPHFDFRKFSGSLISKDFIKGYMSQKSFSTMLNAMNFLINRDEFLKIPVRDSEPWTADSIYFNYLWLKSGNKIYVTPGMQYDHLVHNGSHYKANVHKTGNFYNEIERILKEF